MRARRLCAVLVLVGLALGAPAAAHAAGAPVIDLAWDGGEPVTTDESFLGVPVAVPGDRAGRSLTVRNDSRVTGVLRAWVHDVQLQDPVAGRVDTFYDDVELRWTGAGRSGAASLRELADGGRTLVAQAVLGPGEGTQVALVYELPEEAVSGNAAHVGSRAASFVVHLRLEERTGSTPGTTPGGATDGSDGGSGGGAGGGGDVRAPGTPADEADVTGRLLAPAGAGSPGALASTGADALRLALLGVVGIGSGSLLLGAVRRRRVHGTDADPATARSTCDAR